MLSLRRNLSTRIFESFLGGSEENIVDDSTGKGPGLGVVVAFSK